jgi:hypothetical protein
LDGVREGWGSLSSPTALSVLEGVTHYQFTDSQAEDDAKGCTPGVSLEEAHARISATLVGFFDAAIATGTVGQATLEAVPSSMVEVR